MKDRCRHEYDDKTMAVSLNGTITHVKYTIHLEIYQQTTVHYVQSVQYASNSVEKVQQFTSSSSLLV
jgi:hypothetical protein